MDATIELRGQRVTAVVGALPEERERAQPLDVDLDVTYDIGAAVESDDLADAIDYGALCELVDHTLVSGEFVLLERAVGVLADAVLADPRVQSVEVVVRKLRPPVPQQLGTSGVRCTRQR